MSETREIPIINMKIFKWTSSTSAGDNSEFLMFVAKDDWAVLRAIFSQVDANGNGVIDVQEMMIYQTRQTNHNEILLKLIQSNPSSNLGGLTEDQFIGMIRTCLD